MIIFGRFTVRCDVCGTQLHAVSDDKAGLLSVHPCSKCDNAKMEEAKYAARQLMPEDFFDEVRKQEQEQEKIQAHWQAILNTGSK
jgi:DNA-directed RNA polymerase subunit M/transcription elongation factor TFIIS